MKRVMQFAEFMPWSHEVVEVVFVFVVFMIT